MRKSYITVSLLTQEVPEEQITWGSLTPELQEE